MTSSPAKGTIEKRKGAVGDTAPYISTRSSGDRAFGSGPKGRRFESCRVRNEESPRNQGFSGFFYLLKYVNFGVKTRFGVLLVSYFLQNREKEKITEKRWKETYGKFSTKGEKRKQLL